MTPEDWRRLREMFDAAVDLDPAARGSYLDTRCGGDSTLRRQVESLIAQAGGGGDTIERAVAGAMPHGPEPPVLSAGDRLGPYAIVRPLGRGGMGEVYLAVRADDTFRREVAVKVARVGQDDPRTLLRLKTERRILAELDHQNIARLLDGGTTPAGRPYVVMEYVDGATIDAWCDRNRLTVRRRLELFLALCDAVQYAHRHMIVHRDLKPDNVMVTSDGVLKLLDFGISKLLDAGLLPEVPVTETATRLLTPDYASPEQVRGEPVNVSSDVYSLGVMLYESLAGRRPYRLRTTSPLDVARAVCEQDPLRPSMAVAAGGAPVQGGDAGLEAIAAARSSRPDRLPRTLEGDLDSIVLKALRKEPASRYALVDHLADDIRRHLDGLPVEARRGTWRYRAGKFVRRRRAAVAVATGALVALLAFAAVMAVQAARIARERDRANREAETARTTTRFLVDLFAASKPEASRGASLTAREILDRGAAKVRDERGQDPAVRAALLDTIGDVHVSLGLYAEAEPLLVEALEIRRRQFGQASLEAADTLRKLADLDRVLARLERAADRYRDALAIFQSLHPGDSDGAVRCLNGLGNVAKLSIDYPAARGHFEAALAMAERVHGPEHPRTAGVLANLAQTHSFSGRHAEAIVFGERALAAKRAGLAPGDPALATTLLQLSDNLMRAGRPADARPLVEEALQLYENALGPAHENVAMALTSLAAVALTDGDYIAGRTHLERSVAVFEKVYGPGHAATAVQLVFLAAVYPGTGDYQWARSVYARAQAIIDAMTPPPTYEKSLVLANAAELRMLMGQVADARADLERALALYEETYDDGDPAFVYPLRMLGEALGHSGRLDDARAMFGRALSNLDTQGVGFSAERDFVLLGLAQLEARAGRLDAGHAHLAPILDRFAADPKIGNDFIGRVLLEDAVIAVRRGDTTEGGRLFATAQDLLDRYLVDGNPERPCLLARFHAASGDRASAVDLVRQCDALGFAGGLLVRHRDFDALRDDPGFRSSAAHIRARGAAAPVR